MLRVSIVESGTFLVQLIDCQSLQKLVIQGHLRTDGIVPYSEIVLYWEVFRIMTIEEQRTYQQCFVPVAALVNIKLMACTLAIQRIKKPA